jgi:hypothetical protein
MPHTTFAYPFEGKVGDFAGKLAEDAGVDVRLQSYILTFDSNGNPSSPNFNPPSSGWFETTSALEFAGISYLFYNPLDDGMEYIWLSWANIDRSVMERLLNERFQDSDFLPLTAFVQRANRLTQAGEFPTSWSIMF